MYGEEKTIFLDAIEVKSEIKVQFIDRIRLIFGGRLFVKTEFMTSRRFGKFQVKSTAEFEKVFTRLKKDPSPTPEQNTCPAESQNP